MNFFNFEGTRKKQKIANMSPARRRVREISLLVIVFLFIIMGSVSYYSKMTEAGDYVIVTVDGEEYGRYALDKHREIKIQIDGVTTNELKVGGYQADMKHANCPDKLCVNMKAIHLDGETIVCLPNKVVVEVHSDKQSDIDAMAQ